MAEDPPPLSEPSILVFFCLPSRADEDEPSVDTVDAAAAAAVLAPAPPMRVEAKETPSLRREEKEVGGGRGGLVGAPPPPLPLPLPPPSLRFPLTITLPSSWEGEAEGGRAAPPDSRGRAGVEMLAVGPGAEPLEEEVEAVTPGD